MIIGVIGGIVGVGEGFWGSVSLGFGVEDEAEVSSKAGPVAVKAVIGSTTTVETGDDGTAMGNTQPPANILRTNIQTIREYFRISTLPKKVYTYYCITANKCHAIKGQVCHE